MRDRTTLERFLTATFLTAGSPAGLLARPGPGGPAIDLFTSPRRIGRDGGASRVRTVTGARLLAEIPVGHRYVIDRGWPNEYEVRVDGDGVSFNQPAIRSA